MVTIGEPYVERVEKALVETLILHEVRTAPQTVENFWPKVQNMGFSNKVDKGLVKDSFQRLERDKHVKSEGDRFTITDDGREDIQKIENVLRQVVGRLGVSTTGTMGTTGTTGTIGGTRRT